jgi:hypothetical protein
MLTLPVQLLLLICAMLFSAVTVCGADDNQLKTAKKGDWAEYKLVIEEKGKKISQVVSRIVMKINKDNVLVEEVATLNKKELPAQERVLFFDEPFNYLPLPPDVKTEKLSEGVEKVSLNGKDYACRWVQVKVSGNKSKFDATGKVWLSPDVPLSGVVKFEINVTAPLKGSITSELSSSGRGK